MANAIQDTLEFSVRAEKTLVNDTVKVSAYVSALVAGKTTEETFRAAIKSIVKSLIDTADWQFTNIQRNADDSGFERVTLIATAHVSEKENYNLENRAREASRPGLAITNVVVDTSIPVARIEEAERELRAEILAKVLAERDAINLVAESNYRIGRIVFGGVSTSALNNAMLGVTVSAAALNKTSYGSGFNSSDEGSLGNASKISINAAVMLAELVHNS